MTKRAPKLTMNDVMGEPTPEERQAARFAAAAMRRVIANPELLGAPSVTHIDYSRPRRAEWITMWDSVPGLARVNGLYQHACLPGWVYRRREILSELIPDLEALAEHGVRPTETTS